MDSFEWNKIAGALLFALLLSVGVKIISETLFSSEPPKSPGYVVAVAEPSTTPSEAPAPKPIAVLLASADPQKGQTTAKRCMACHTLGKGEPNRVGPNLYGVVGRPIASHAGYSYDDAMKAFAEKAKDWTFDNLNAFLTDPKAEVPGTKMAFPGLPNDQDRANVIAYLRTLSDNPVPLPPPPSTEASAASGTETASAGAPAAAGSEAPAAAAAQPQASTAQSTQSAQSSAAPAPATGEAVTAPSGEAATSSGGTATSSGEAAAPSPQAPASDQTAQAETPAPAAPASTGGDPAAGETYAKRCSACHSFDQGGPNKVGPHLFGVVGRTVASVSDYNYSDAMKAFSEGGTKKWDASLLDTYLANPRGVVPGTKMAYVGIKTDSDRANVIAYLETLKE